MIPFAIVVVKSQHFYTRIEIYTLVLIRKQVNVIFVYNRIMVVFIKEKFNFLVNVLMRHSKRVLDQKGIQLILICYIILIWIIYFIQLLVIKMNLLFFIIRLDFNI